MTTLTAPLSWLLWSLKKNDDIVTLPSTVDFKNGIRTECNMSFELTNSVRNEFIDSLVHCQKSTGKTN